MFYYSATGKTFISKIAALEHKQKTGSEIFLYYHDDKYKKIDWSIEPTLNLDAYYKLQAERLRSKYDYLILCYSGGYDSTNILETFYYNNIALDKIVIVGAFSQDVESGNDQNHNGELYHNAFPLIDKLGLSHITEKHDYTDYFSNPNNFDVLKYGENWVDHTGAWFSPHNWFWRDIEKHVIPKNIGSKKVGLIFGRDKPSIVGDTFRFFDPAVTSYGAVLGTQNCDRINFYWDPDFPDILVKQLHLLKRFANMAKANYHHNSELGTQMCRNVSVNRLIYDLKNPLTFKSPKSKTTILSARDTFLRNVSTTDVYLRYADGLKNMNTRIGLGALNQVINSRAYKI